MSKLNGAHLTPLCLTLRSSGLAYGQPLIFRVSPHKTLIFRPCFFKRYLVSQALFSAWLAVSPGFACKRLGNFKPFWPPALAQQALLAIILQALRRLRGAVLFHRVGPSLSWGCPFWVLGLTRQSSRPAYCGRLTLGVRNLWTIQPPASFFLGYRCFYGMGYQLSHLRILYSRMPLKIATLPLAFRLLFGRFFVSQLTYLGCWHTGLCIIHHFPRGTVSELV